VLRPIGVDDHNDRKEIERRISDEWRRLGLIAAWDEMAIVHPGLAAEIDVVPDAYGTGLRTPKELANVCRRRITEELRIPGVRRLEDAPAPRSQG
jgi:hypothetical protein